MIHRWKDVPANLQTPIYPPTNDWGWADNNHDEFSPSIHTVLTEAFPNATYYDGHTYMLEIGFRSTGYDDTGVLSGPAEACYPPESEDERRVDWLAVYKDLEPSPIPKDSWKQIEWWYEDMIYAVVIDTDYEDVDNR
jgi:hypothetical protein